MASQNTTDENKRIVREFIKAAFNDHQPAKAGEYLQTTSSGMAERWGLSRAVMISSA